MSALKQIVVNQGTNLILSEIAADEIAVAVPANALEVLTEKGLPMYVYGVMLDNQLAGFAAVSRKGCSAWLNPPVDVDDEAMKRQVLWSLYFESREMDFVNASFSVIH